MTDSLENQAYEEAYKCSTVYSHHKRKGRKKIDSIERGKYL